MIYRERELTQLTDLGKEVLPILARTLASAQAVRRRAQEFQRKEVAPLKIGLAPSISASLVLDLIAEIAKFVPGLRVELREGAAEKLVDLLLEGEINAAMVGDVQDIPARIDDWSLFEERYVALLAPTHRLANRPSIGIDDLRETVLLERAGCDVAPKILRSYFSEEPPRLGHRSGHDLHLQHMGQDVNILTQIGFVVLVGLAAKNAILIVEFARDIELQGRSRLDAVIEACRLRLRPILMTSFAFILGVVPLVVSTGSGSEMRQAVGVAVFFGMLGVTLFGLIFTPIFYMLVRGLADPKKPKPAAM